MDNESSEENNDNVVTVIMTSTSLNIPNVNRSVVNEMTNIILSHLESITRLDVEFINFISEELEQNNVMSETDFSNLPKSNEINNCPICFVDNTDNVILECNHIFCTNCIKEWLTKNKNNCPICRK